MEFNFVISSIIKKEICIITKDLLPEDFSGDIRSRNDCAEKICKVLDEIGWASAKAQGLQRSITSGQRLKDSEHILYLLVNLEYHNGHGCVLGLLKIGRKKLFMFDLAGYQHEVEALCILDFYIHEAKQRTGCGKKLFEYMLMQQNVLPQHLAIDRPSEKFLSFLYKHYGLEHILPQMNNFVVFDGFFNSNSGDSKQSLPCEQSSSLQVTRRVNNQMSSVKSTNRNSAYDLAGRCTNGRFSAHRPESTMGLILHDKTLNHGNQRSKVQDDALNGSSHNEHPTYIAGETQSTVKETSCPANFLRQKDFSIPEDKSAFRHSRLW